MRIELGKEASVSSEKTNHTKFTPSTTEEEAKIRFVKSLENGVGKLVAQGNGRDRISTQLLNEIANGCSPDETEIFQTMETLGISLEDATKVMTVSSAFRSAQQNISTANSATSNNTGAIDQLTSRLNLADLLRGGGNRSRSPSPLPSPSSSSTATKSIISTPTSSSIRTTELNRNESLDSLQSRNAARKGSTKKASTKQQQGRGRKRALADKVYEKRDSNVMIEEQLQQQKKNKSDVSSSASAAASAADRELNAKLESADKKLPASSSKKRAKSPESGGLGVARGKRTSVVATREETPKRARRTRSQTEESIPDILLP